MGTAGSLDLPEDVKHYRAPRNRGIFLAQLIGAIAFGAGFAMLVFILAR